MAEFDCVIYKVVYNLLYFTFVSFDIKCCARECQAELNAFLLHEPQEFLLYALLLS